MPCTYKPDGGAAAGPTLAALADERAGGAWQVCVGDSQPGATGSIERIALTNVSERGNGRHKLGEFCDDGNLVGGDGCDPDGRFE